MTQQAEKQLQSLNQMRMGVVGAITAMVVCFGLSFALSGQVNSAEAENQVPTKVVHSN